MSGRDGFTQVVRAEWTKLRSVRRWMLTLVGAALLTILLSLLVAAGGTTDYNMYPNFVTGPDGTPVADEFHFAHQSMTGDGSIVARVVSQENSQEWAGAGIMMKDGLTSGSRYAAVLTTPGHGVRMQANFTTDIVGGDNGAGPHWLKLTRHAGTVTGYESDDGLTWREIGTVTDVQLPNTVQIGLFVSSPQKIVIERQAGSTSVGQLGTTGVAVFDNVHLDGMPVSLSDQDIRQPHAVSDEPAPANKPGQGREPGQESGPGRGDGGTQEAGGVYTVTGTGKIGPNEPDDDIVQVSLFGIFAAIIALMAIGVLFMTSEYKRGMLRTTFAASPRRGRVLAAKAAVLGAVSFATGLFACVAAFYTVQPLLRDHGWAPPAFPIPSLADGPVLRAVLTTAAFVAAIALLSLGLATIMRHSAAAITTVIVLVVMPFLLGSALPVDAARWLIQVTPAAGLATLRAKPPTTMLADPSAMINPWVGLGVTCLYAGVSLVVGWWLLRRRDA